MNGVLTPDTRCARSVSSPGRFKTVLSKTQEAQALQSTHSYAKFDILITRGPCSMRVLCASYVSLYKLIKQRNSDLPEPFLYCSHLDDF